MNVRRITDLVTLLRRRADEVPDQVAFRYLDETHAPVERSFAGLARGSAAVAEAVRAACAPYDRVLLLFPPGLDFIDAFLGVVSAGCIAVPAPAPNPRHPDRSLQRIETIVQNAGPTAVLTVAAVVDAVTPLLGQLPAFRSMRWIAVDRLPDASAVIRARVKGPDIAMLQYTSGSTSDPKGVALTHDNLVSNLEAFDRGWDHGPGDVIVSWLPTFHDLGLVYGVLMPLWAGITGIQMSPVDVMKRPAMWLEAITRHRGTHSAGPNFIYDLCTRKVSDGELAALDLRSWRVALTAAEPVRAESMQRFTERFAPVGFRRRTFCPGYGLSEATCKVVAVPADEDPTVLRLSADALARDEVVPAEGPGSFRQVVACGPVEVAASVAIVDPRTGRPCPPDRVGEIWVAGPGVAAAYWEQPDVSDRQLRARIDGAGASHLRTGDLGFIRDGQLFVTGRIKDVIIVRGHNHYPQDIEQTVQDAHPHVRPGGCAAFAIAEDGDEELVVAVEVEPRWTRSQRDVANAPGIRADTDDGVVSAVVKAVASQHGLRIDHVAIVAPGTLPKTTSGKIRRGACRAMWKAGQLGSSRTLAAAREALTGKVRRVVADVLGVPPSAVEVEASLYGYGVDSLQGAHIAYELGLLAGRDVPQGLLEECDTIAQIVSWLLDRRAARVEVA